MILKTAANYNDEGGYIEAWKNGDGTTEVKLIPKSGGGDEGKQGLKSITISPAIETTPALDSLFPIYWEDLTEEEKQHGINITVNGTAEDIEYTITVTPTDEWYAMHNSEEFEVGGKGEPVSYTVEGGKGVLSFTPNTTNGNTEETATQLVGGPVLISPNA